MKKISVFVLAAALAVVFMIPAFSEQKKADMTGLYKEIELFADAVSLIRMYYVDTINAKTLVRGALKGMMQSLDDYSQYMEPENYEEMKADTKGEFGGLGIEIGIRDGMLTIISPMDGTPAKKAGIQPKDVIVRIDGVITRNISSHEAVTKLRGKPGTKVELTIFREKDNSFFNVTITREIIEVKSVKKTYVIDNVGYIKLVEFQENTAKELEDSLAELKSKSVKGIILDLRNNAGGLLNTAIDVSELFLGKGQTIVSIKGRIEDQNKEFKAVRDGEYEEMPLVVLVNEGSASASEIVSGAMKDNRRGILVGQTTFGKGSVQTVIPLGDGSALRLTTAEYFTPGGYSIHKKGIVPDIEVPYIKPADKEKEKTDIFDKLENTSPKEEADQPPMDNQLKAAIDTITTINICKGN